MTHNRSPLGPSRVALVAFAALLLATATGACSREKTATVAGPPLTVDPAALAHRDAGVPAADGAKDAEPAMAPVTARFVELSSAGAPLTIVACETLFVAVARGKARVLDADLAASDAIAVRGQQTFDVKGEGLALVAAVRPRICEPDQAAMRDKKVVRGAATPELTWAHGAMHANLDVREDVSQLAYLGRLRGTAPVAEHTHDSWEVLAAVDAAGSFTVDGVTKRLLPRQVVVVPANTKHSWMPDNGASLEAIQMYVPPGPEQRFKALAQSDDAGAGAAAKPSTTPGDKPSTKPGTAPKH